MFLRNLKMDNDTFPTIWKIAEVTPILKNGDHEEANNNRPISLLPILSKILQPGEESTFAKFVLETAKVLLENGRLQDFPYMADRSADLLHGNKILKQILSEITSKCDEKTAYEEMQRYMYRLVLEELLQKSSVEILAILALLLLQKSLLATMEYLVPFSEAIEHELQPEKIANELKTKLDEYTRCEIDGEAYLRSSDYNKAIQSYEKALAISTELGYQLGIVNGYHNLASVYFSMAQFEKVIVYLNECLTVSVKIGNQPAIAGIVQNLGEAYSKLERYEESIDYFEKSLDMYTKLGKWEEMANNNAYLGAVCCKLKKYEKCIVYFDKSLDMYTKLGNSKGIASSNGCLGDVYFFIGQYEEASRHLKNKLARCTEMGDQLGIATTNGNLGCVFSASKQHEKALECFNKSIAISTEIGYQSEIASANADLGSVYRSVGEYEKAITHSEIALRISGSVNDKSGQATFCRNLGEAYNELKRCEKAIFYNKKALGISTEIGDQLEMASSNANLGVTYLISERFEKAKEYFEKALAIGTDIWDEDEIATIIGNMGDAYLGMRQLDKAFDCYKKSLVVSAEIGNQSGIANNNGRLGNIYVKSFKFEEAIPYYEKAAAISNLTKDRKIESHCLANLGKCYYLIYLVQLRSGLEPLKRSISYFRKSIECHDSIFLNLIVDENQTSFTNQYVTSYVVLKCCFISLERFKTALLVADLGKAKTLQVSIEKRSNVADYARKTWQAIDEEKEEDQISEISKAIQLEKNCATVLYYSFDCMNILNVWVLNCSHGNVNISIPTYTLSSKDYIHTSVSKLLNTFNLTIDRGSSFFNTRHDVLEDDVEKLPLRRVFRNEISARRSEAKKQDLEKVAQRYDLAVEIEKKKSESKILENLNVDKPNMNEGCTDSSEHLRKLFMALIQPIQEFIKGTKLIIIPDDFLFFAPFSALLDENGVNLSEKYSIQITPSLHTLYSRVYWSMNKPVWVRRCLLVILR